MFMFHRRFTTMNIYVGRGICINYAGIAFHSGRELVGRFEIRDASQRLSYVNAIWRAASEEKKKYMRDRLLTCYTTPAELT